VPWDQGALAFYLKNGWHEAHGISRGPMAEVTQNLASASDADVQAIAGYIVSIMGEPSPERRKRGEAVLAEARRSAAGAIGASGDNQTQSSSARDDEGAGALIYQAACAMCHESGRPLPFGGIYFSLSTAMYGPNAKNLSNVTLAGLPAVEGEQSPIMPGFAGALTDAQLAALTGYLRGRFSDQPPWQNVDKDIRAARSGEQRGKP
jgi:mono/diheme cytochrome c family protein